MFQVAHLFIYIYSVSYMLVDFGGEGDELHEVFGEDETALDLGGLGHVRTFGLHYISFFELQIIWEDNHVVFFFGFAALRGWVKLHLVEHYQEIL